MVYTVRYAHLEKTICKVGDYVIYGSKIGIEGTTGTSSGVHLHLDVVEGVIYKCWRLADMVSKYKPSKRECEYFIDDDIWTKGKTKINNGWLGYKNHYAYDIINTIKNSRELQWNRSYTGKVIAVGFDEAYGNYVLITYDNSIKTDTVVNETPKSSSDTIKELTEKLEASNKEISAYKDKIFEKDKKILELSNEKELLKSKIVNIQKIVN